MEHENRRDRRDGRGANPGAGIQSACRAGNASDDAADARPWSADPTFFPAATAHSSAIATSVSVDALSRVVGSYVDPKVKHSSSNDSAAERELAAATADTAEVETLAINAPSAGTHSEYPTADKYAGRVGSGREKAVGVSDEGGDKGSGGAMRLGVVQAVMGAAQEVAQRSAVPGVSEAATLVVVLVKLASDTMNNPAAVESRERWCRSILLMLERAAEVLGKVSRAESILSCFCSLRRFMVGHPSGFCQIVLYIPRPTLSS